jgi:hypothetical protein
MPNILKQFEGASGAGKAIVALLGVVSPLAVNKAVTVPAYLTGIATLSLFAVSVLTIIAIVLSQDLIARCRSWILLPLLAIAAAAGVAGLVVYDDLRKDHVILVTGGPENQEILVPTFPSEELADELARFKRRFGTYTEGFNTAQRIETFQEHLAREAWKTTATLLALLLLAQAALVFAVVGGIWRLGGNETPSDAREPAKDAPRLQSMDPMPASMSRAPGAE